MLDYCLIFLGAGLGGVLRFCLTNVCTLYFDRTFPYGTLIVNITGCFVMGLFFTVIFDKFQTFAPYLRAFLIIGFLGGYTTFSSFSIETLGLFQNSSLINGFLYIFLSVSICIFATWLGMIGAKQF